MKDFKKLVPILLKEIFVRFECIPQRSSGSSQWYVFCKIYVLGDLQNCEIEVFYLFCKMVLAGQMSVLLLKVMLVDVCIMEHLFLRTPLGYLRLLKLLVQSIAKYSNRKGTKKHPITEDK